MLDKETIKRIKEKMKKTYTYCASFARELGVSRQMVHMVLNQKTKSQRIEKYLIDWLKKTCKKL